LRRLEVSSKCKGTQHHIKHSDITHKREQTTALQLDGSEKGEFILRPSRVSFNNSELDSHRRLPAAEERRKEIGGAVSQVNRQVKRRAREEKENGTRKRSKKEERRGSGMGGRRWERESLSRLTPKQEKEEGGGKKSRERGR
jgi:hypothetical protein